jgi:hypothetical protein
MGTARERPLSGKQRRWRRIICSLAVACLASGAIASLSGDSTASAGTSNHIQFNMLGWSNRYRGNMGENYSADYLLNFIFAESVAGYDLPWTVDLQEMCSGQYLYLWTSLLGQLNYVPGFAATGGVSGSSTCGLAGVAVFARANSPTSTFWPTTEIPYVHQGVGDSDTRKYLCVYPVILVYGYAACTTHLTQKSDTVAMHQLAEIETNYAWDATHHPISFGGDFNVDEAQAAGPPDYQPYLGRWYHELLGGVVAAFEADDCPCDRSYWFTFDVHGTLASKLDYIWMSPYSFVADADVHLPSWAPIGSSLYGYRVSDHKLLRGKF